MCFREGKGDIVTVFKKGDCVTWCSGANNTETVKVGVIIAVVPADYNLYFYDMKLEKVRLRNRFMWLRKYSLNMINKSRNSLPRNHESYLVLVKNKYVYWPRVKYLSMWEW
ncbi:MAG: hypothetical protein WC516_06935 [Patescibacteria group bacterium]